MMGFRRSECSRAVGPVRQRDWAGSLILVGRTRLYREGTAESEVVVSLRVICVLERNRATFHGMARSQSASRGARSRPRCHLLAASAIPGVLGGWGNQDLWPTGLSRPSGRSASTPSRGSAHGLQSLRAILRSRDHVAALRRPRRNASWDRDAGRTGD